MVRHDQTVVQLSVVNLRALEAAYGPAASSMIHQSLKDRLEGLRHRDQLTPREPACGPVLRVSLVPPGDASLGVSGPIGPVIVTNVESLDRWLAEGGYVVCGPAGKKFVAQVVAGVHAHSTAMPAADIAVHPRVDDPSDKDAGSLIRDMQIAADWLDEISTSNACLSFVPVRHLGPRDNILHFKAEFSQISRDGQNLGTFSRRTVVNNLGLGSVVELLLLKNVIELIQKEREFGINIELSLGTIKRNFNQVVQYVCSLSDIDQGHFSITICPDMTDDLSPLKELRSVTQELPVLLGLALSGRQNWITSDVLSTVRPDFIVISAALLRSTLARPDNLCSVAAINALAGLVAPVVIAEGIDTPLLATNASTAGIKWGEGFHMGAAQWSLPKGVTPWERVLADQASRSGERKIVEFRKNGSRT